MASGCCFRRFEAAPLDHRFDIERIGQTDDREDGAEQLHVHTFSVGHTQDRVVQTKTVDFVFTAGRIGRIPL